MSVIIHGESYSKGRSKEYSTWVEIKTRCYNSKYKRYEYYGAKGVKMCDRWLNSFVYFLEDMGRAPTKGHSIDRINNDGNYEPGNCRWATKLEQMNNRSNTLYITLNNEIKSINDWCRELGKSKSKIYQRIHRLKWEPERAFKEL